MTARKSGAERRTGRVNVRFPVDLLEDLRRYVPARRRSQIIVEGTERMLAEVKQREALKAGLGAWTDANHPGLNTQEDINDFLADLWASTEERAAGERVSD